jgi:hypothetical protein
MKFLIITISLFLSLLAFTDDYSAHPDSPLYDMKKIMDESTLDVKVIKNWHLVKGKIDTRQKHITINVGEFWPGKNYRIPVRFVVPADKKAKGFHLTGGHNFKALERDARVGGLDQMLVENRVGMVMTVVQEPGTWGEREFGNEISQRFAKSLNPHDSIQYWGWPATLSRAITAAYAEKGHFEKGKIAMSGSSKNGATPTVVLIHDKRTTAVHATVSPIWESPLRLCDKKTWEDVKKYNAAHGGGKRPHGFLGGTYGPVYNDRAMEKGHSWEELEKLAHKVSKYIFVSQNLAQLKARKVQMLFHPGTHDFVAFDLAWGGNHYPQIPIYLRANSGHGKRNAHPAAEREQNKTAFMLNHFFDADPMLNPPKVTYKKTDKSIVVEVKFDQDSVSESGQIWWFNDRGPDGSLDYIKVDIPKENSLKMTQIDNHSWTVDIPIKSGIKQIDFFSNHRKTIKYKESSYPTYISSPYTRVKL